MHQDHQHEGFKAARPHGRKEWGRGGGEQHQLEAREHARQPDKTRRTHDLRAAEADRQIRELRARG